LTSIVTENDLQQRAKSPLSLDGRGLALLIAAEGGP